MVPFLLKIMQHVHGAGWDPPQGSDGVEEELALPLCIIYQQSWLTGEVCKCNTHLRGGLEGGCGELQPDHGARGSHGANHCECHHY